MEKQAVSSSSEIEGSRTESDGAHAHASALKKGPWTAEEDAVLAAWVDRHGEGNWGRLQRLSGLARCGKSCRLRWTNHLRPHLKKGPLSQFEELLLISLHRRLGNKWSRIAAQLPGRTDNEIKNFWNTRAKRLRRMGLPLYPPPPLLTTPGSSSSTDDFANDVVNNCNFEIHKLKKLLYDACTNLTNPPHQDKEPSVSIQGATSHEFVDGNKNTDASYAELLYHKQNISRSLGISQAPYMFLVPPPHSCISRPPLLPPHHYQNYCSNKEGPSCDITSFPSPSFEHKNNLLSTTRMCVLSPQEATDGALFASTNCNGAPHYADGILQKSIINPGVLEQLLNGTAAYQTNAAWDAELNLADTSLGEVLDPCTSLIPDMEASHVSSGMASQGGGHRSSFLVDQTGRIHEPMKPDETASRVESQELMMSRQAVEMQQASLSWNTMNVAGLEELLEHLPTHHVSSNN